MQLRVFIFCSLFCSLLTIPAVEICAQSKQIEEQKSARLTVGNRSFFPLRRKPTKEQKKQLLPKTEDVNAYALFLEQPNTGIFRLLPDLECEANSLVIKVTETCLSAIPESSYYSFREREHEREILSDIRLKSNHFISDGILSQGIMVALGDVALENITPHSEGLKFLNNYVPQTINKEAQKQFVQITKGVKSDKYVYGKIVPVKEDTTYAMRVIAYKGNVFRSFRGFHFDLLAGDKRVDLTLAFRVIRQDKDGGVTLVWKELARKDAPKLRFERKRVP